ncbi:hypothetical protein D3C72_1566490 [compost metagenome]
MADGHALCVAGAAGTGSARPRFLPRRRRPGRTDFGIWRPAGPTPARQRRRGRLAPALRGRLPGPARADRVDGAQGCRPARNRNSGHPGGADARSAQRAGRRHPVARHAGPDGLRRRCAGAGLLGAASLPVAHPARGARTGRAQRVEPAPHRRPGARGTGHAGAFSGRLHGAPVREPGHPAPFHCGGRAPAAHAPGRAACADGSGAGRRRSRRAATQPRGRAAQRRKTVTPGQSAA